MKKDYMKPALRAVEIEHSEILMESFENDYGSDTTDDSDGYHAQSNSFDVDNDFGWRE